MDMLLIYILVLSTKTNGHPTHPRSSNGAFREQDNFYKAFGGLAQVRETTGKFNYVTNEMSDEREATENARDVIYLMNTDFDEPNQAAQLNQDDGDQKRNTMAILRNPAGKTDQSGRKYFEDPNEKVAKIKSTSWKVRNAHEMSNGSSLVTSGSTMWGPLSDMNATSTDQESSQAEDDPEKIMEMILSESNAVTTEMPTVSSSPLIESLGGTWTQDGSDLPPPPPAPTVAPTRLPPSSDHPIADLQPAESLPDECELTPQTSSPATGTAAPAPGFPPPHTGIVSSLANAERPVNSACAKKPNEKSPATKLMDNDVLDRDKDTYDAVTAGGSSLTPPETQGELPPVARLVTEFPADKPLEEPDTSDIPIPSVFPHALENTLVKPSPLGNDPQLTTLESSDIPVHPIVELGASSHQPNIGRNVDPLPGKGDSEPMPVRNSVENQESNVEQMMEKKLDQDFIRIWNKAVSSTTEELGPSYNASNLAMNYKEFKELRQHPIPKVSSMPSSQSRLANETLETYWNHTLHGGNTTQRENTYDTPEELNSEQNQADLLSKLNATLAECEQLILTLSNGSLGDDRTNLRLGQDVKKIQTCKRNMYWMDSQDENEKFCMRFKGNVPVVRILAFGDSLTRGYFASGMGYHPYTIRLEHLLNVEDLRRCYLVANEGRDGEEIMYQMPSRLSHYLMNSYVPFSMMVLFGGTNDLFKAPYTGLMNAELMAENCFNMVTNALARGIRIAILTVPQLHCEIDGACPQRAELRHRLNDLLRRAVFMDPFKLVLVDLDKYLSRNYLNRDEIGSLWEDGLHLTPFGYDRLAEIIYFHIRSFI